MGAVAITLARLGNINPRERVRYVLLKGPERGRSTAFASLEANAVGWGSGPWRAPWLIIAARELPPTWLPPNKSGVADLPLSGSFQGEVLRGLLLSRAIIVPFSGTSRP